jgi:hypothetical protein
VHGLSKFSSQKDGTSGAQLPLFTTNRTLFKVIPLLGAPRNICTPRAPFFRSLAKNESQSVPKTFASLSLCCAIKLVELRDRIVQWDPYTKTSINGNSLEHYIQKKEAFYFLKILFWYGH